MVPSSTRESRSTQWSLSVFLSVKFHDIILIKIWSLFPHEMAFKKKNIPMEREETSDTHGLMELDRPDYFSSKSTFLLTITLSHFLPPAIFFRFESVTS